MDGPVSTSNVSEAIELWQRRGWVLVDGLVPTADIDAAVEPDLWEIYPRPRDFHGPDPSFADRYERESEDISDHPDRGNHDGPAFRGRQFLGHRHMPYPGTGRLNRLTLHPNVVAFAKAAMGSDDLRIYQTRIWGKYTGVANYEQPFHLDRNHNVVPGRMEPGWWNMEGFLYLSDVVSGLAPTHVHGTGAEPSPDAGTSASGIRGSYLAYRPDVWHRGVDMTMPGGARFLMNIAFKHAGHDWIGYDSPQSKSTRSDWVRFAATCSPEELALFGAPLPGHAYWTDALVTALGVRYPGLDVTPWRQGLTAPSQG